MNASACEILRLIYTDNESSQRTLAQRAKVSLGKVNKSIKELTNLGYLNDCRQPTAIADALVETFKPTRAVILAAGPGLRLIPLCRDIPKALLEVHGEILIERLIRQLHEVGIHDIHIVVGYMKEKFEYLIDKYHVKLIVNASFDARSNLYSLYLASAHLHNSYIVPCDLYCYENPFSRIETYSWYMVSDIKTSNSRLTVNRNLELVSATANDLGNYEMGIAYLAGEEAAYIKQRLANLQAPENFSAFWEISMMRDKKSVLLPKIVKHTTVCEINTYDDLISCDAYSSSLNSEYIDIICQALNVKREDISHVKAQKAGMTNRSFLFYCNGNKYIFRIPGEGTDQLINRQQEFNVYQQIRNKNLCDDIIYINPSNGYKITRFIDHATNCDPMDAKQVEACMQVLRGFHELNLTVDHAFDIFGQLDYYEMLRGDKSVYDDYEQTKQKIFELKAYINGQKKTSCLCHIDSVCDNFIFSKDRIYLIDWEYAGMQDPHVDIAMFAIYALYDKCRIDQLIDFYFQNNCDKSTRLKIYCYIAACGLLWSNWCEYKAALGETFGEYSLMQYRYAKEFYQYFKEGLCDESC